MMPADFTGRSYLVLCGKELLPLLMAKDGNCKIFILFFVCFVVVFFLGFAQRSIFKQRRILCEKLSNLSFMHFLFCKHVWMVKTGLLLAKVRKARLSVVVVSQKSVHFSSCMLACTVRVSPQKNKLLFCFSLMKYGYMSDKGKQGGNSVKRWADVCLNYEFKRSWLLGGFCCCVVVVVCLFVCSFVCSFVCLFYMGGFCCCVVVVSVCLFVRLSVFFMFGMNCLFVCLSFLCLA